MSSTMTTRRQKRQRRAVADRTVVVVKAITSEAVSESGKLNPAQGLPGGSGLDGLIGPRKKPKLRVVEQTEKAIPEVGLIVSPAELANAIIDGEAKEITRTKSADIDGQTVLLISKQKALGTLTFGKKTELAKGAGFSWSVKRVTVFDRPTATNVTAGQKGLVGGVRLVSKQKAKVIHDPISKIRKLENYDPARVSDVVLRKDAQIVLTWYSQEKRRHCPPGTPKADCPPKPKYPVYNLETIETTFAKILKEAGKRGSKVIQFNPKGMSTTVRPFFEKMAKAARLSTTMLKRIELAPDSDPADLTDAELGEAHATLHKMHVLKSTGAVKVTGWSVEKVANMHARIVDELGERDLPHPEPPGDTLDTIAKSIEVTKGANPFAAYLRRKAKTRGLTVEKVAEKTGMSVRMVNQLFAGKIRAPHDKFLDSLAKLYGVSTDHLRALAPGRLPQKRIQKGLPIAESPEVGIHLHNLTREQKKTKADGAHLHIFDIEGELVVTTEDGEHDHKLGTSEADSIASSGAHGHKVTISEALAEKLGVKAGDFKTNKDGAHGHGLLVWSTAFDGLHGHKLKIGEHTFDAMTAGEFWARDKPAQAKLPPAPPASSLALLAKRDKSVEVGTFSQMPTARLAQPEESGEIQILKAIFDAEPERFPAFVQKRHDGKRYQIHKKADAVTVFDEDGDDQTEKFPAIVQEVKTLKVHDLVLDAIIGQVQHGTKKSDDSLVANFVDVLYFDKAMHDQPTAQRVAKLAELEVQSTMNQPSLQSRLNVSPVVKVDDLEQLEKAARIIGRLPSSTGVVTKSADADYFEPGEVYVSKVQDAVEKNDDPYLEIPREDEPHRFVMQQHWVGKRATTHFRTELRKGKLLLGWELGAPREASGEPVTTLTKALELPGPELEGFELLSKRNSPAPATWLDAEGKTADPTPGETPVGASSQFPGVFKTVEKGLVEYGAQKPWFHEYFVHTQKRSYRLFFRKMRHGELVTKAKHSYSHCMECSKSAPTIDVLWADGRGRAWFHKKDCFGIWLKRLGGKTKAEVVGTKKIIGGNAPQNWSDLHKRVDVAKSAEPHPLLDQANELGWIAIQPADKTPNVITIDAVKKQWIPPLGVSALPEAVRDQVPPELEFWNQTTIAKARKVRDTLVEKIAAGEVEIDTDAGPDLESAPADAANALVQDEIEKRATELGNAEWFVPIQKIDTDKRLVTGIVLEPGEVDAQNDTVSAEVIEKASIKFLARFNDATKLGVMHKIFGDVGLQLAHSWIALSATKIGGKKVKKGTWLMTVKVVNDALWKKTKAGKFTGFSIGGVATVS